MAAGCVLLSVRGRFVSFDPVAWREAGNLRRPRHAMARKIVRTQALVGLTQDDVFGMLGKPFGVNQLADFLEPEEAALYRGTDWYYWVGPERGFISIDSEWLFVLFGPSGQVTETRLMTD